MEVRMGSPLFGTIEVHGLKKKFDGRLFGEAMAFSPDSCYLAIAELTDGGRNGPVSRVVVIELSSGDELIASPITPGLIRKISWVNSATLSIVRWAHPFGESTIVWTAPKQKA